MGLPGRWYIRPSNYPYLYPWDVPDKPVQFMEAPCNPQHPKGQQLPTVSSARHGIILTNQSRPELPSGKILTYTILGIMFRV